MLAPACSFTDKQERRESFCSLRRFQQLLRASKPSGAGAVAGMERVPQAPGTKRPVASRHPTS